MPALVTTGLMLGVGHARGGPRAGLGLSAHPRSAALSLLLLDASCWRQATAVSPCCRAGVAARTLRAANVVTALMVAGLFGFQFLLALFLSDVLGWGGVATGLAYLPGPLAIALISLGVAARLGRRFGYRPVLVIGLIVVTGGFALLARIPLDIARS